MFGKKNLRKCKFFEVKIPFLKKKTVFCQICEMKRTLYPKHRIDLDSKVLKII